MKGTIFMETTGQIIPIYIEDEMKHSYINYAMSVIVGRALPNVRDGLKPVHRRILYAMHEMGLSSNKPHKKSARIVGEVLGKYHPHGDVAVYDSMVRMTQEFLHRYPLVDGQGNFGSIDGDNPAAMRYTEVKLSQLAEELLEDIEKETCDFIPNFDESLKEPTILPTRVPNLLVNGSSGIAVGMATNMPPHNLGEVIDGVIAVIDNLDMGIDELIKIIPGPDFPTGGIIFGMDKIKEMYRTGRGIIPIRAKSIIDEGEGSKSTIIITEIPYMVNKAALIQKIGELVREKKIEGISELRDESDREGMRIVIEIKRDENPLAVLNQLYKHTDVQTTFGVIMLALVDNQPRILPLKELIYHFIEHRKEIITRRTKYDLKIAKERADIVEGLRHALNNLDLVIQLIRTAKTPAVAKDALIENLSLTMNQAQAILELQLQRLTSLERNKLDAEYLELIKQISLFESILTSPQKLFDIMKKELRAIKEKYTNPRRTQIIHSELKEFNIEDLITEEEMVITLSHMGYIKRLPMSTYRKQHRGGVGITAVETRDQDFIEHLYIASTHDYFLFFTTKGRCYWLKVYEIPEAGRYSKGKAIINLFYLEPDEKITTSIPIKDFNTQEYLIMCTQHGLVKKTLLGEYSRPRKGGIIALRLKPDDKLIKVERVKDGEDLLLATKRGKAIRFSADEIRSVGRSAQGVRGIRLKKKDLVVGMEVIREGETLLTIVSKGYGKRTKMDAYRRQARGGMGVIDIKATIRNGEVVAIYEVKDEDEVMMLTESGMIIRYAAKEISVIGRNTQGLRLMRITDSDRVVGVALTPRSKEDL